MTQRLPCTVDPDAWFPDKADQLAVALAKAGCAACPVLTECRTEVERYEATSGPSRRWGIWAGLTPEERHPKPIRRRPPAPARDDLAEQVAS